MGERGPIIGEGAYELGGRALQIRKGGDGGSEPINEGKRGICRVGGEVELP